MAKRSNSIRSRICAFPAAAILIFFSGLNAAEEDLTSVREAFRRADPSLNWFSPDVLKKSIDAGRSVLIARAAPAAGDAAQIGVFVVSGVSNHVDIVLDRFPQAETDGSPQIREPDAHSVDVDFYGDYGMYEDSLRCFYELTAGKALGKVRYHMLELYSSRVENGILIYDARPRAWSQASESADHHRQITIEPGAGSGMPSYRISEIAGSEPDLPHEERPIHFPDGESAVIVGTRPGQAHQTGGIAVVSKTGTRQFYPVPVPDQTLFRRMRPAYDGMLRTASGNYERRPAEIQNDIGPAVVSGSKIWFANTFYDGEGVSGVGAIGSFDMETRKYQMRWLPEIAAWSGSAIRWDNGTLWIGLMRQPEGAAFGGGLLRYNVATGVAAKVEIPDYIDTLDRVEDTIYCGTVDGLYTVTGSEITHLSFEPDATGKLVMITHRKRG